MLQFLIELGPHLYNPVDLKHHLFLKYIGKSKVTEFDDRETNALVKNVKPRCALGHFIEKLGYNKSD